ncbi:hypothetical protein H1235_07070 [Pseudoxanthomonas sp. NC8]|nr:hypothetical protein H1235_07070 [Pseudoxanthomonas sp. NC8]
MIAAAAALKASGTLGGWMLVTGESGARAAQRGFLPAVFGRLRANGSAGPGAVHHRVADDAACRADPLADRVRPVRDADRDGGGPGGDGLCRGRTEPAAWRARAAGDTTRAGARPGCAGGLWPAGLLHAGQDPGRRPW